MTEKVAGKTSVSRRILSIALIAVAAVLLAVAVTGYIIRGTGSTGERLNTMRTHAVLHAASGGLVDKIASEANAQALKEIRKQPDFRSLGTAEIQRRCGEAEAAARAEAEALYANTEGADSAAVEGLITKLESALVKREEISDRERNVYAAAYTAVAEGINNWRETTDGKTPDEIWAAMTAASPELANHPEWKDGFLEMAAGLAEKEAETAAAEESAEEVSETDTASAETVVDYKAFVGSDELKAASDAAETEFAALWDELVRVIPDLNGLDKKTSDSVRNNIETIVASASEDFSTRYNAYVGEKADKTLNASEARSLRLTSNAENFLLLGIAVALLALLYTFWKPVTKKMGVPRSIILLFFIYLLLAAQFYKININLMLGNILERVGMYGVLALAMLPGIQCGIGLNMGMTIGCISGLFAIVVSLQYNMTGAPALIFSLVLGLLVAIPLGWAYSLLLNRMKGNEMTISTYVGFSFVSLMCIGWMALPFNNPKIIWMLAGHGLRVTHGLLGSFAHTLDRFLSFKIFGVNVPSGTIIFFLICCLLIWLFSRSKMGIRMSAVGSNPRFAEASGIDVDNMRTLGTILSTVLAAIGIVIYSQSFGYAQLYNAPRQLGFIAASAILIGGATTKKASVGHVIIGVILFEGVLCMGQQVANAAVAGGGLSEVMRIMISNGIILYALTQSGGDSRA